MLTTACEACRPRVATPEFSMAFQPIVDLGAGRVFAYEALVRGPQGEPAPSVLSRIDDDNRYSFDQACRVRAIQLAAEDGLSSTEARLSINFMPSAVYRPENCIRATLSAARRHGLATERIMFEVTEDEPVRDRGHLRSIFESYRRHRFLTAIDDFGAGFAGLTLLSEFQPDVLKIDMGLVRNVDADRVRTSIVTAVASVCRELRIRLVAEGVETEAELRQLRGFGIELFQGYLFAKPAFGRLPPVLL